MTDFRIDFNNPWLLLLFIPVLLLIFIPFFRIPRRFRGTRNRVISVVLHTLASALCICLIAGVSFSFNESSPSSMAKPTAQAVKLLLAE